MNKVKNIKDLPITLNQLYLGEKQINIHLSDKSFVFHVVLADIKGHDCKISSFGANLWARTKRGLNYKKYDSVASLQRELKKLIGKKVETEGEITFSLSEKVYTF